MIDVYAAIAIALTFAIILIITNYLAFGYGVRFGKALQKEIPPVPLAEPVEKVTKSFTKYGKRMVKLVYDIKESKAYKKEQKEETGIYD